MKVTKLVVDNFKAFDHLEADESFFSEGKYLLVGKNGSGKTTFLEALRFCLAHGQDNAQQSQYLYGCVRDRTKEAKLEAHIELDDDEIKICQDYLQKLNNEGGPAWNNKEQEKYDLNIVKDIVSRVSISTPFVGSGQNRTGSMQRSQTYLSAPTLQPLSDGSYQPVKFHIISKLFSVNEYGKPMVYLNPFRTVQFQDTMLFQNYNATVPVQGLPGSNQVVNDPINSVNYSQPEFGKNYFQFSYAAELYSGVLSEFYNIAKSNKEIKQKIKDHIAKDMVHINEMLQPKVVDDVDIDLASNALTYQVDSPEGRYSINGLSAGEEQLVIFGLSLPKYLNLDKSTIKPVVIVDEPELHLHPEYCKRLGKFFSKNLPVSTQQQLFIASHSVEIIQELADCAYQVNARNVTKVTDVMDRTALFHNLGANFSVADIVNRIVFVEGEEGAGFVTDSRLYQRLADDPYSRHTRFVGVGNKRNVARVNLKAKDWVDFVKNEIDGLSVHDIFGIVDGDVLGWVNDVTSPDPKLLILPCYSVENLLLQPKIIARAYPNLTKTQIENAYKSIKKEMIEHTAQQVAKEYIAQNRKAFVISNTQTDHQLEDDFKKHIVQYRKDIKDLPVKYKAKVNQKRANWYLYVVGKQLRIALAKQLGIKDSKKNMFNKLSEVAKLDDMPKEMRTWFKNNLANS